MDTNKGLYPYEWAPIWRQFRPDSRTSGRTAGTWYHESCLPRVSLFALQDRLPTGTPGGGGPKTPLQPFSEWSVRFDRRTIPNPDSARSFPICQASTVATVRGALRRIGHHRGPRRRFREVRWPLARNDPDWRAAINVRSAEYLRIESFEAPVGSVEVVGNGPAVAPREIGTLVRKRSAAVTRERERQPRVRRRRRPSLSFSSRRARLPSVVSTSAVGGRRGRRARRSSSGCRMTRRSELDARMREFVE